ncbi:hypothetical protein Acsp01_90330 [Actinoplanes sp. NBRC 101535]|nr:hypothetical protein Acsp01_90330 [Actinoplanes sp. NBRC 101535]
MTKLPWIPTEQQWLAILDVAAAEPIRNRVMLALAYDAALRREELCSLRTDDLDPRTARCACGRRRRRTGWSGSCHIRRRPGPCCWGIWRTERRSAGLAARCICPNRGAITPSR